MDRALRRWWIAALGVVSGLGWAADDPWVAPTSRVDEAAAAGGDLLPALDKHVPEIVRQARRDARSKALHGLWGHSHNFDDDAKSVIVQHRVVEALGALAGMTVDPRTPPAGLIHTYGYLLSNHKTPFGYKRVRWTEPAVDAGFGLPRGTIAAAPRTGTLLANATLLFGRIAFQGDGARLGDLVRATGDAADAIAKLDVAAFDIRRITETLDGRVELRTDVVTMPRPPRDERRGLTHLLVYSVRGGDGVARLITGFPVTRSFVDGLFDPKSIGKDQPIRPRYNAAVPGLVAAGAMGSRVVSVPRPNAAPLIFNDSDWPPFFFAGRDPRFQGLAKEILGSCLAVTGRQAIFENYPIKRMRRDLMSGGLDVNIYSYEKDRESFVFYSKEALFRSAYQPVVRADSLIEIRKLSDFDALRLGHLAGLTYSPEFKAYVDKRMREERLDVTDSEESNLRKLLAGRIDVYVNSSPTVLWLAKQQGQLDKIKVLPFAIKSADYFVALSKASPRLNEREKRAFLDAFDGCVRLMKKDGSHARILASYGLPPLSERP